MRPSPFEDGVTPLNADNLNERTVYAIGDLDVLLTQNKTSLVAAINENKNNIDALPNKWNQTLYVDSKNGSDTDGDGSLTAPFKTIVKAIDSIPVGGRGFINLAGGQTFLINSDILLYNKTITLKGLDPSAPSIIQQDSFLSSLGFTIAHGFYLAKSSVVIGDNIILKTGTKAPDATSDTASVMYGLFRGFGKTYNATIPFSVSILGTNTSIEINHLSLITSGINGWFNHLFVTIHNVNVPIVVNDIGKFVGIVADGSTLHLGWYRSATFNLTNNSPQTISSVADLLYGIIKDTNGTPRNVVSNVVL